MNNRLVMKGLAGEVRWAYHRAATVSDGILTAEPSGITLTAKVVSHDAVAVSQRPLMLVIPRPTGQWRWPVQSLQIADGTLRASLGPQE